MRIYHTETQADYNSLMVELEEQGCEWLSGDRMTELSKNWKRHSSKTCVSVDKKVVMYDKKSYYTRKYPEVPIQKYKAKVGEKMKFTKENVEKVIDEYFWQADLESCGDLIAEIYNLDDTPEKVVVPKFVADWIESCKEKANLVDCLQGSYHHYDGSEIIKEDEDWLFEGNNQDVVARAWLEGYEVEKEPFSWAVKGITDYFKCDGKIIVFKNEEEALEVANLIGINTEVEKMNNIDCQDCISIEELRNEKKEQLYYVALPKLDDSDFRYLWTDVDGAVYTQNRKGLCIGRLKHTESEIKAIDERYWPFAVPAND